LVTRWGNDDAIFDGFSDLNYNIDHILPVKPVLEEAKGQFLVQVGKRGGWDTDGRNPEISW